MSTTFEKAFEAPVGWRATHADTGMSCPVSFADVMHRVDAHGGVWVDEHTAHAGDWLFEREAE